MACLGINLAIIFSQSEWNEKLRLISCLLIQANALPACVIKTLVKNIRYVHLDAIQEMEFYNNHEKKNHYECDSKYKRWNTLTSRFELPVDNNGVSSFVVAPFDELVLTACWVTIFWVLEAMLDVEVSTWEVLESKSSNSFRFADIWEPERREKQKPIVTCDSQDRNNRSLFSTEIFFLQM